MIRVALCSLLLAACAATAAPPETATPAAPERVVRVFDVGDLALAPGEAPQDVRGTSVPRVPMDEIVADVRRRLRRGARVTADGTWLIVVAKPAEQSEVEHVLASRRRARAPGERRD